MSKYNYIIAVDFEATCFDDSSKEIIEFAAVLKNIQTGDIANEFHKFVHPTENPQSLTKIEQSTVNKSGTLHEVLKDFKEWIRCNIILRRLFLPPMNGANCVFVTWSKCDFKSMLLEELDRKGIAQPNIFKHFIDLQQVFMEKYKRPHPEKLVDAMNERNLKFNGRQHSGIDDARNLALLTYNIYRDGAELKITDTIPSSSTDVDWMQ